MLMSVGNYFGIIIIFKLLNISVNNVDENIFVDV